ncbi:hypothetical protein [Microcoleus sp. herbarium12]|uniref:hypothetical protein n=1 Tax=Microcoleus sp. herbarium12 TaxID=3055437 RepID=UPI002FD2D190
MYIFCLHPSTYCSPWHLDRTGGSNHLNSGAHRRGARGNAGDCRLKHYTGITFDVFVDSTAAADTDRLCDLTKDDF